MRRLSRPAPGVLTAAALAVTSMAFAACAPARPAATAARPSPTPRPDIASTIAFTITVPHGWADVTGDPSTAAVHPSGPVLVLLQTPPRLPVVRGVNDVTGVIVVTELDQPLAAAQVAQYLQSVRAAGATDLAPPHPVVVGGSGGTSITYASTLQGTPVETEDIVVVHSGAVYEIELITSRQAFPAQALELDRMLSHGWTWVSGD